MILRILCTAALLGLPAIAAAQTPGLKANAPFHDFGTIAEQDGVVRHPFVLRNTGDKPAVITSVHTDCGCVRAEFSRKPVPAGGETRVVVAFDPAFRPGHFSKELIVLYNERCQTRLRIAGDVTAGRHPVEEEYPYDFGGGVRLNRRVLIAGRVAQRGTVTVELGYANDTEKPMMLRFETGKSDASIRVAQPGAIGAGARGETAVTIRLERPLWGLREVEIHPVINGRRTRTPLVLRFWGVDDFTGVAVGECGRARLDAPAIDFGELPAGAALRTRRLTLSNTGSAPLVVRSVQCFPAALSCSSAAGKSIAPGHSLTLTVRLDPGKLPAGAIEGRIILTTRDKADPVRTIYISGRRK